VDRALVFDVVPGDFFKSGTTYSQDVAFLCDHEWAMADEAELTDRYALASEKYS